MFCKKPLGFVQSSRRPKTFLTRVPRGAGGAVGIPGPATCAGVARCAAQRVINSLLRHLFRYLLRSRRNRSGFACWSSSW